MKILALLAALALSFSANADTVTLSSKDCGLIKQCIAVPNDSADAVSVYGAPGYPWFYVYITATAPDGTPHTTMYVAAQSSAGDQVSVPLQSFYFADPLNLSNKVFTGQTILFSATWTGYRTCARGPRCGTHYVLAGGSIVR